MRTAAIVALCASGFASAQVVIAEADFQDGTTQGWSQPFGLVDVRPDAGPDGPGDYAIEARAHPAIFNLFPQTTTSADFLGDWIDKQVIRVTFDAMNPSSSTDTFKLYAVMMRDEINRWASLDSATIPNDGAWRSYSIDLGEADVINVLGGGTYGQDFASIARFGLRHQEQANQAGGSPLSGPGNSVLLDNIRLYAVPAPATLALVALGATATLRRRR